MLEATALNEADLDAFLALFEVNEAGEVTLGDLSNPCHQVGLEGLYQPVHELLAGIKSRGEGITREEIKRYLLSDHSSPEEELERLFAYLDYDHRGSVGAHRLKLCTEELLEESLALAEASDMISLLAGGRSTIVREDLVALPRLCRRD